jgi:alkylation response protein AidB-like acyl-CoA dehydrogenase
MTTGHSEVTLDLLADVAVAFCKRDPDRVRAVRDSDAGLDREMWRRIADNGWLTILVPEQLGGAGIGLDAVAIIARQLGYGAFPEPFVAAGVLAPLLLSAAADQGAEQRLAPVLDGSFLVGVAWDGGVRATDRGRLSGLSRFTGVAGADAYVVACDAGLFWVESSASGLSVREERLADGSFSAELTLDGVAGEELVAGEQAQLVLGQALDAARVALSAELLGICSAALELTVDYLKQRKQFGRPIGSFQALQHRAVDMWMERELASAAVEAAVRVFVDPLADDAARARAAASAKARLAHSAPLICTSALQAHGAIGFTDEYELGLYLNRAMALAPWLGNASAMRRRWVDLSLGAGVSG